MDNFGPAVHNAVAGRAGAATIRAMTNSPAEMANLWNNQSEPEIRRLLVDTLLGIWQPLVAPSARAVEAEIAWGIWREFLDDDPDALARLFGNFISDPDVSRRRWALALAHGARLFGPPAVQLQANAAVARLRRKGHRDPRWTRRVHEPEWVGTVGFWNEATGGRMLEIEFADGSTSHGFCLMISEDDEPEDLWSFDLVGLGRSHFQFAARAGHARIDTFTKGETVEALLPVVTRPLTPAPGTAAGESIYVLARYRVLQTRVQQLAEQVQPARAT